MSVPITLPDLIKSLPISSDAGVKDILLSDANGTLNKANAEGMMISAICKVMFGAKRAKVYTSYHHYGNADWKLYSSQETYWTPFYMSNTNAGDICIIFDDNEDGVPVSLVCVALDKKANLDNSDYRALRPIVLFIRGYKPFWSPLAPSV